MKTAIVHDWLTDRGGAEKVLHNLLEIYPHADLYCLVDFMNERDRGFLGGRKVHTSFIQKLPFAKKRYRSYLPLMPLAIEQFDLSQYDLVISSSYAVAKGVITGPGQFHVSYIHSPIRYAWDLQHQYLKETKLNTGPKSWLARAILHYIRMWDIRTANGVDLMTVNSKFIRNRVRKCYGRDSTVIYPPVDTSHLAPSEAKGDYFVTASRLVPYKKVPLIVEAFTKMPDKRLIVIGDGPEMRRIKEIATPNIEILGFVGNDELHKYMAEAKAFVFAAEDDFGIVPVESQALGTPVIAYGKGGVLETVVPLGASNQPTGLYFKEQTPDAICAAVQEFVDNSERFDKNACIDNAARFSRERFLREFADTVNFALAERA
ncbi:glycosyltransferase family 4 protein [Rhizobium sp. RM]|uniref:glycosyltransferase family 4 protein n=1 Tax=Rhizobium sp. RM TaxID=2748079 RepID=UPI00110E891C|nr:glycosyltransferase family 4 protein [Rhizobium sp. RM]NWJ23678.1 glycosyltransferase family 4 protein [Rhizobium sp. RM]TMV19506.1 glycosyltransferase family 4 protein [Rhizobium sp. Td3]